MSSEFTHALRATSATHVRRIALHYAEQRAHKFTRVSQEFLDQIEYATLRLIKDRVARHPSRGQTLT